MNSKPEDAYDKKEVEFSEIEFVKYSCGLMIQINHFSNEKFLMSPCNNLGMKNV